MLKQDLKSLKIQTLSVHRMQRLFCQAAIDKQGPREGIGKVPPILPLRSSLQADTYTEVDEKVDEWLEAGCQMVWVINPRRETVEIYRSPENITVLHGNDVLDGGDVIEGFSMSSAGSVCVM